MPLPSPNLDDRSFDQLVDEARRRVMQLSPQWTDLSPSDPGMVLLELFAHLTETMIYRLNRVPSKAYVEFLGLIGVRLHPPAAAGAILRFTRSRAGDQPLVIPRGTRVTLGRSDGGREAPVFATDRTVTIPAGQTQVEALAHHCDLIEGELAGKGTGMPGLTIAARRPPIIAPTGDELDLVVGVEARPGELGERVPAIHYQGKTYRVWREVDNFINVGPDRFVYVVDRISGTITFAPSAQLSQDGGILESTPRPLAAVPAAEREIRLWYRRGGGPEGNVAADTLTALKDPIPSVEVTNPSPATGGRAAESVDNALIRGPQELHSLQRAVTARDFELVALRSSRAVARARAVTRAALWKHATPGTVEVLLVPYVPEELIGGGRVTVEMLREHQTPDARDHIQRALDERRPLGTTCVVNWARYKVVRVRARIVVHRQEDVSAVEERVLARLYQTINPLPTRINSSGWGFGEALRASNVYDIALAEPGVHWVDRVQLLVDQVPDKDISSIVADQFQPRTWYAGSGATMFRSLNGAEGWEPAGSFFGEQITLVRVHPERPGLLAVATRVPEGNAWRVHTSQDSGETWEASAQLAFEVEDMAWLQREGVPVLLLATDLGLYELAMRPGAGPVPVLVDAQDQNRGLYAIAVGRGIRGELNVAVAAQNMAGVFLSHEGGKSGSFRHTGLRGEDVRRLAVQYDGVRSFLWAGVFAPGGEDPGKGCFRWELLGAEDPQDRWQARGKGWQGGSCYSIAFRGGTVLAGSHHGGVLRWDTGAADAQWQAPDVRSGLPLRDAARFTFLPVNTVASDPQGQLVLAGGAEGVFRSRDGGATYETSSQKEFSERVTLPETWLFCSGTHEITVVSGDEAARD